MIPPDITVDVVSEPALTIEYPLTYHTLFLDHNRSLCFWQWYLNQTVDRTVDRCQRRSSFWSISVEWPSNVHYNPTQVIVGYPASLMKYCCTWAAPAMGSIPSIGSVEHLCHTTLSNLREQCQ